MTIAGTRKLVTTFAVGTVIALMAISSGCTNNAPTAPLAVPASIGSGSVLPASSGTFPPPGSFVTSIVREGLVSAVPVAGEPHRANGDPRAPAVGTVNVFPLTVTFPEDWRNRSLVICGWTAADGFYECKSLQMFQENGVADLGVPVRQPHDMYELWLLPSDASTGLRRLVAFDTSTASWPLHLHVPDGYQRANDVLSKQPPSDGNYLVAG